MAQETAFENGNISNCQRHVTITWPWPWIGSYCTQHTIVHHSSTSTYIPNFAKIEETFCEWVDVRTDGQMDVHLRPTLLGRLRRVDLKMSSIKDRGQTDCVTVFPCLYVLDMDLWPLTLTYDLDSQFRRPAMVMTYAHTHTHTNCSSKVGRF